MADHLVKYASGKVTDFLFTSEIKWYILIVK